MLKCCFVLLLSSCGAVQPSSSVTPATIPSNTYHEAERELQRACGHACVSELARFEAEFRGLHWSEALERYGNATYAKIRAAREGVLVGKRSSSVASFRLAAKLKSSMGLAGLLGDETACSSPVLCKLKQFAANACNYGRLAMQELS
eukprot:TRINITY_DN27044_c0_g1_i1.p1 TRINITY_DN27044_c0_g1~~TRINITY_DN27044_c0_g1_i1.p1  ORF type:complete len:163 (-),score=33.55 TRINITY_DN27044_c0_g1_i1:165-605(-)